MAYSELIKNFDRIRDYMRQFYVYGFKSRAEYDKKSARSYDNERRRIESWLGDYMSFRQTPEGKNVFLSVDSRSIPGNPLYSAFKAKSFTSGDVTFHFYILDLLRGGSAYSVQEIVDLFLDKYLRHFESDWQPDVSTIRKKLKEYVALGILECEKRGRELVYRLRESSVDLAAWADTVAFFSEADPLGVVGSYLLDRMDAPDYFQFKHHYILHTLDSRILLALLTAMGDHRRVKLTNSSQRGKGGTAVHTVYPLHICVSTQSGRQYLLCYHLWFRKMMFYRLDYIQAVEPGDPEPRHEQLHTWCEKFRRHFWGTSGGEGFQVDHIEMTIRYGPDEDYIPRRLQRERRNGKVLMVDEGLCKYVADVYDASEMLPWIRTFIGRIVKLECSNRAVVSWFYESLEEMAALYEGEKDAVQ